MTEIAQARYVPEVGQAVFGAAYSAYSVPDYVDALVDELLEDMGRVYGNIKQEQWEHSAPYDLDLPGVVYHPYYWGDCTCGFEEQDTQWSEDHEHTPECFNARYHAESERLQGASGLGIEHEQLTRWARDNGYPDAPHGMAVYCDCGYREEYGRWRKSHNHDLACPIVRPNLAFEGVEIRWYKHPGRGMSSNVSWTPDQWVQWFDRLLAVIRATDSAHMNRARA